MWFNWKGAWSGVTLLLVLDSLNDVDSMDIAFNGLRYQDITGRVQTTEEIMVSSGQQSGLEKRDKPNQVTDLRVEFIGKPSNETEWNLENITLPIFIVELKWTATLQQMDRTKERFDEIRASLRKDEIISNCGNGRLMEDVRTENVTAGHEQSARFKLPIDLINSTIHADENSTDIYFVLVTINSNNQVVEMSNVARGRLALFSKPPLKETDKLRGEFIILASGILIILGALVIVVLATCNLVIMCKKNKNVYEIDRDCKVYVINV